VNNQIDDSFRLLAAEQLRKQARQLFAQLKGIRQAEDIEYVHRARVATRRLRAGLRMFDGCFGAKRLKRWAKAIRRLTSDLGEARDKDVQVAFVRSVLDHRPKKAYLPGIVRVLVHLERQREALQPAVLKAIKRLRKSRTLAGLMADTKRLAKQLRSRGVTVVSQTALSRVRQQILARLADLRALEHTLADRRNVAGHHALRIAAKRLRYAVEISRPIYSSHIDAPLATLKQIQSLLGEIHDCDVWVANLEAYCQREQKRIRRRYGHAGPMDRLRVGIEYLRRDRQTQRDRCFEKLVRYWHELTEQGFWHTLRHTVSMDPERGAQVHGVEASADKAPAPQPGGCEVGFPALGHAGSDGDSRAGRAARSPQASASTCGPVVGKREGT